MTLQHWAKTVAELFYNFHKYSAKYGGMTIEPTEDGYRFDCGNNQMPSLWAELKTDLKFITTYDVNNLAVIEQWNQDVIRLQQEFERLHQLRISALLKLTDEEKKVLGIS